MDNTTILHDTPKDVKTGTADPIARILDICFVEPHRRASSRTLSATKPARERIAGMSFPTKDGCIYLQSLAIGGGYVYSHRSEGEDGEADATLLLVLNPIDPWLIKCVSCDCAEYEAGLGDCRHVRELVTLVRAVIYDPAANRAALAREQEYWSEPVFVRGGAK